MIDVSGSNRLVSGESKFCIFRLENYGAEIYEQSLDNSVFLATKFQTQLTYDSCPAILPYAACHMLNGKDYIIINKPRKFIYKVIEDDNTNKARDRKTSSRRS